MQSDGSGGRDSLTVSGEIIVPTAAREPVQPPVAGFKVIKAEPASEEATREWDIPPPPVWNSSESMEAPTSPHARPGAVPAMVSMSSDLASQGLEFSSPFRRKGMTMMLGLAAAAVITGGALFVFGRSDDSSTPMAASGGAHTEGSSHGGAPVEARAVASAAARTCPTGMRYVEGGSFTMGSNDDATLRNIAPARQVNVESFCIAEEEVALRDYQECSKIGECKRAFRDSDVLAQNVVDQVEYARAQEVYSQLCNETSEDRGQHPVNCVTWQQARSYCAWKGWRLPSEVEWEFAARGTQSRRFPWGDAPLDPSRTNACGSECTAWKTAAGLEATGSVFAAEDGFAGTAPVGTFATGRTPDGLHDFTGNVAEWTEDVYEMGHGRDGSQGRKRVVRGGSFSSSRAIELSPAFRSGADENVHTHDIGFRCAAAPRQSV